MPKILQILGFIVSCNLMDTRKTKKKDVGTTHGARGQENQLPGAEEKS